MVTFKQLEKFLDRNSVRILKLLKKGECTDAKIAKRLRLRPNTVRRILNELHIKGILNYRKERERSGWYNYIWRVEMEKLHPLFESEKTRYLESLRERLEFEELNQFFICPGECARVEYSRALDSNFKCPICGDDLKHHDNSREIKILRQEIEKLK